MATIASSARLLAHLPMLWWRKLRLILRDGEVNDPDGETGNQTSGDEHANLLSARLERASNDRHNGSNLQCAFPASPIANWP